MSLDSKNNFPDTSEQSDPDDWRAFDEAFNTWSHNATNTPVEETPEQAHNGKPINGHEFKTTKPLPTLHKIGAEVPQLGSYQSTGWLLGVAVTADEIRETLKKAAKPKKPLKLNPAELAALKLDLATLEAILSEKPNSEKLDELFHPSQSPDQSDFEYWSLRITLLLNSTDSKLDALDRIDDEPEDEKMSLFGAPTPPMGTEKIKTIDPMQPIDPMEPFKDLSEIERGNFKQDYQALRNKLNMAVEERVKTIHTKLLSDTPLPQFTEEAEKINHWLSQVESLRKIMWSMLAKTSPLQNNHRTTVPKTKYEDLIEELNMAIRNVYT